jgi:TatD DNase family protein
MLIDTHCHIPMLIDESTDRILTTKDRAKAEQIINQAIQVNVREFITIGSTSYTDSVNCSFLTQQFDCIFAAVGLFPHDCTANWSKALKQLIPLIKSNEKIVAIGECGLDFHYPDYNETRQKDAFKVQIEMALEHDKALVVHTRQAPDETLKIIDEFKNQVPRGVFHCFSEDLDFANYVTDLGFYLGVPATITYPKNDRLRTIVKTLGLNQIVLETDSPYLPPQHMRGQKNDPSQVATVAAFVAQLLGVDLSYVEQKTTENANRLFKLPTAMII